MCDTCVTLPSRETRALKFRFLDLLSRDLDGARTATDRLSNSRQVRTSTTSRIAGSIPSLKSRTQPSPLFVPLFEFWTTPTILPSSNLFSVVSILQVVTAKFLSVARDKARQINLLNHNSPFRDRDSAKDRFDLSFSSLSSFLSWILKLRSSSRCLANLGRIPWDLER